MLEQKSRLERSSLLHSHVNSYSFFSLVLHLLFFLLLLLLIDLLSRVQQTYLGVILAWVFLHHVILGIVLVVMGWLSFLIKRERESWYFFFDARVAAKANSGIGRGDWSCKFSCFGFSFLSHESICLREI